MASAKALRDLALTIHGQYELAQMIELVTLRVSPILKNFIGSKITVANGNPTKKLAEALDLQGLRDKFKPLPLTDPGFASFQTLYLSESYNAVFLHFSICLNGGSYDDKTYYCQYFEQRVYIGDTLGDKLDMVKEPILAGKKLSMEGELAKIAKWKELQAIADKAKGEIDLREEVYKYL